MLRVFAIGICLLILGGVAFAEFTGYDPTSRNEMPGTGWVLENGLDPIRREVPAGSGTVVSDDGIAHLDCSTTTGRWVYNNTGFDAATGLTVDFKTWDRLSSATKSGVSFQVGVDDEYRVIIHVFGEADGDEAKSRLKVSFSDGGDYYTDAVPDRPDLDYFHTWRFVSEGSNYAVYVDDQVNAILSGTVDPGDRDADSVHFGDWGSTTNGNADLDYVVWDNTQAIFSGPLLEVLFPGDANRDGMVTAGDYASIQSSFGNTGDPGIPGDANGDGVVSAGDYSSVQANYGNIESSLIPVPEPTSLCLLGIGVLALIRKKN